MKSSTAPLPISDEQRRGIATCRRNLDEAVNRETKRLAQALMVYGALPPEEKQDPGVRATLAALDLAVLRYRDVLEVLATLPSADEMMTAPFTVDEALDCVRRARLLHDLLPT